MAEEMKQHLNAIKSSKDYIKNASETLLKRDAKIGKAFQAFDDAVEERVKEVAADSKPVKV